jgi:hypothetical protein
MANKYDDTNTFVMFKDDVEEGSNKPMFTGYGNWNGEKVRFAGWVNKDSKGQVRINGKLSEFQAQKASAQAEESPF